ncbi:MAG: pseudaminic acid cytidylyltransferase [Blautia sp.]|nr:pseudaminic acid cytidylyltransferase [Lachnoclostridium sp.]MCM1212647.1 pseudaminic acid cytidylyltransferase [Blautia sp.]
MNNSSIAIITARGGSKRIPHKNIKEFCGKPIITYSIEAALQSGLFEEVMVSTEDADIAAVAQGAGAQVPFMRSDKNANDYASTDDVLLEVLERYQASGREFETFCCLYPTAPFVTAKKLQEAMKLLETADSVMPVTAFSYPPQRCVILNEQGELRMKWPEYAKTRSQDLETYYHDCGQFYCCRTKPFLEYKTTDLPHMAPMVISGLEVQDIDSQDDWDIAELKYRKMMGLL